MITGIIAAIILIAVLPPAIEHGQILVIAIALFIAFFLVMLGSVGHECEEAESNFIRYWAKGGPERENNLRETHSYRGNHPHCQCPRCSCNVYPSQRKTYIFPDGKRTLEYIYKCEKCGNEYRMKYEEVS